MCELCKTVALFILASHFNVVVATHLALFYTHHLLYLFGQKSRYCVTGVKRDLQIIRIE